ncbi:MAG: sensor histidine kinase [Cyanobacteria bacterium P01_A01_bin.105]
MSAASSAFIDLCQAQFRLLHQTLGTLSAVVYVTEVATATPPDFVPVFHYPQSDPRSSFEAASRWLPQTAGLGTVNPSPFPGDALPSESVSERRAEMGLPSSEQQVVLPLIHQDAVVGAMVVIHHERRWRRNEQRQLQQVADTVAAGYVLERQSQWLQQQLRTKRQLQGQQSEIFHNLLHQFRNPLTALGTFGKLLVRRLPAEDPNHAIANSMVRESQQLSALVKDFDQTVEMGDADWQSLDDRLDDSLDDTVLDAMALDGLTVEGRGRLAAGDSEAARPSLPAAAPQSLPAGLGHALTLTDQALLPLMEPLLALGQTLAVDRQLRFYGVLPSADLRVRVDAQALQEVTRNLLDNALKYASPGDWVWLAGIVDARPGDTRPGGNPPGPPRVGIAVGDTGAGIPVADQPHLFERRYRGVQSEGSIPGTGLGLAIAQDLVTQMDGQIELLSPITSADWVPADIRFQVMAGAGGSLLRGTLFIVWLPLISAS